MLPSTNKNRSKKNIIDAAIDEIRFQQKEEKRLLNEIQTLYKKQKHLMQKTLEK